MIFATSNAAGNRIMSHLYNTAAARFPAMRTEARSRHQQVQEEEAGVMKLFEIDADAGLLGSQIEQNLCA